MRTRTVTGIYVALIAMVIATSSAWAAKKKAASQTPLTEAGRQLAARYADQLDQLRTELTAKLPQADQAKADTLNKFLASDALDAELVKYVVLLEATPQGLAAFAQEDDVLAADEGVISRVTLAESKFFHHTGDDDIIVLVKRQTSHQSVYLNGALPQLIGRVFMYTKRNSRIMQAEPA